MCTDFTHGLRDNFRNLKKKKKKKKKNVKNRQVSLPFLLPSFSSIVLENVVQEKTWETIEYLPNKAIIQDYFCGTYVVPPGPRTIGICSIYVVLPAMERLTTSTANVSYDIGNELL